MKISTHTQFNSTCDTEIHMEAMVRQYCSYIEALEAGGPDTLSEYDVRKVGDLYPPVSDQEEEVKFVLLNLSKGEGSWDQALAWARSHGYKITNPREAFAVAEQHDLWKLIDQNTFYLVATTECSFEGNRRAVCVRVDNLGCRAEIFELKSFGDGIDWFIFRK